MSSEKDSEVAYVPEHQVPALLEHPDFGKWVQHFKRCSGRDGINVVLKGRILPKNVDEKAKAFQPATAQKFLEHFALQSGDGGTQPATDENDALSIA
ncbi:hypothetical protein A2881_03125 [Candidatus Peribacteria bacterium RIFCSPHIGHO2_01_FULL_55_13]|nr:MAG: hypothetical protein A2881_03125 [Candidatus Peribacteria bacterium RIFCSPHIGHO2_01_FULL_55_13]OGJ64682.1 MAG: hypothetical protein A3F36_01595 [Candidatus Peribacteria bacterium RIFCSPHIGHO2_12_FULL_55_11]